MEQIELNNIGFHVVFLNRKDELIILSLIELNSTLFWETLFKSCLFIFFILKKLKKLFLLCFNNILIH